METNWTRREVLKGAGALAAAGWLGLGSHPEPARAAPQAGATHQPGSFRIAHLTDIHVQPEKKAAEGLSACLKHVAALDRRPDLILTGGDLVMDAFEATEARTKTQWDILTKAFANEACAPVEHTLGNHDIWGFNKKKSQTTGDEPRWGKKWAMDLLGMTKPYRSLDRAGWRLIVLDSVRPSGDGYTAYLEDEQLDWLERELAAIARSKPILVVSHVPIFAPCAILDQGAAKPPNPSPSEMHTDAIRLHKLFVRHGVKLSLSGHIHQLDRADYHGVTYICDGAVCGSWWNGPKDRVAEGYGVIDLRPDGTFDHRYVPFGWVAPEPVLT